MAEKISAKDIASYIFVKCARDDKPVSPMTMQKILYVGQGRYFKQYGIPMFEDKIIAGIWGPTVESVYKRWALWGAQEVYRPYSSNGEVLEEWRRVSCCPDIVEIIDPIIEEIREMKIWEQQEKFCGDNSLWEETHNEKPEGEIRLCSLLTDPVLEEY